MSDQVTFEIDSYRYATGKWWGRIVFRYDTLRAGVEVRVTPHGSDFPDHSNGFDTEEELRQVFAERATGIIESGQYRLLKRGDSLRIGLDKTEPPDAGQPGWRRP